METGDPAVDLNNMLQQQPNGSVAHLLEYVMTRDGPPIKPPILLRPNVSTIPLVRGVTYAEGTGMTIGAAKRDAAGQVLERFMANGVPGPEEA
ncbi:hypothetical protein BJV74DRAFT_886996 [Russula compacta]|nr:hypothetical protein BJV74DRAFT_886996 [Russula compacta]